LGKKHLWKVIKEANYTSFPGFFGKLFRHCNTLPLSSNRDTMKLFLTAMDTLLKRGEKVLIYPEQAMWWNYKKPRPFKPGAFRFAVSSNVPVLPCFLTMKDSDKLSPDGSYYQEYTLHIFPAIYSEENLNDKENAKIMADKNFELWKNCYETTYNQKLTYSSTEQE
jgi:1-acyl-sn-glycerol-3-phosphate acyltransferase